LIDEFGGADKIEGDEYCSALKTGSGIPMDPYRELKRPVAERIKREKGNSNLFLSSPLPEGLQMTLLTTVEILTPLSVMAPRDGRGVRRPA